MSANYDNSAWFYDRLSQLVYGKALNNAQEFLLSSLAPKSKILIAGGGTGRILEQLTRFQPSGLTITYVEVSKKMLSQSRRRSAGENKVLFINEAVENMLFNEDFDAVITPFLFDNFKDETLNRVFGHLHKNLREGGLWLNADFQLTGKWWQAFLLRSMFIFFRIICQIEASKLPDIKRNFASCNYIAINQKTFFGDFVIASVYQK